MSSEAACRAGLAHRVAEVAMTVVVRPAEQSRKAFAFHSSPASKDRGFQKGPLGECQLACIWL